MSNSVDRLSRREEAAEQVRKLLDPHKPALINRAVELALAGDPACLRLCLERISPLPRPEAEKVFVPGLAQAPTLQAKATAIMGAVASGHISAEAGDRLMKLLDTYAKAIVADDHEKRLALLEGQPQAVIDGEVVPELPPPDDDEEVFG